MTTASIMKELTKSRDRKICGTQKYLIIALSLSELGFVILSNISSNLDLWVGVYILIVITNMYYFIMFAITLERFLEIRLNINYHLYLNKKVLISVYIVLNVGYITLYLFSM